MSGNPTLRILIDICLVVLTILGYWYIALPVALIAAWVFHYYIELVILGFMHDAIFGLGRGLGLVGYIGTAISVVSFSVISFLKVIVRQ